MGYMYIVWLAVVVALVAATSGVTVEPQPQDGVTTVAPIADEEGVLDRPIDRSMMPIYTMVNWFIEVALNPVSVTVLANKTDLTSVNGIMDSLRTDWQTWASHYYSFIICAVFTLLFVLALPIAGIVICCCRSRGRCGANTSPFDGKYTKHKRRVCAILLGLLFAVLLLGVTSSFIANQLVHEQTNSNMTRTMTSSIQSIKDHKALTLQQLDHTFTVSFPDDATEVAAVVQKFPGGVQDRVGETSGAGALLLEAAEYIDKANETSSVLAEIDKITNNLHTRTVDITTELTSLNTDMNTDFGGCTGNIAVYCQQLLDIANKPLETVADYDVLRSKMADNYINDLNAALGGDIYVHLSNSYSEYNKISAAVATQTGTEMETLVNVTAKLVSDVQDFQVVAAAQINGFSMKVVEDDLNSTINPWINRVGNYRYYGGIAVSSLALLIAVLVSSGLLVGACGERAGDKAENCNRGQGACLLLTATGVICGLSWILAICSLLLLMIGGVAHNDLCSPMVGGSDREARDLISNLVVKNFNISLFNDAESLFDVFERCEADTGIYSAAKIDQIDPSLNVTLALDISDYNIDNTLNALKNKGYTTTTLALATSNLQASLQALEDSIKAVDLQDHETEKSKNITSVDLNELLALIDTALADVTITDATFKSKLSVQRNRIANIIKNDLQGIERMKEMLHSQIKFTKTTADSFFTAVFHIRLTDAQAQIDSALVQSSAVLVADDIGGSFAALTSDYDDMVRNRVGRCGVVHTSFTDVIDSVCIQFLFPFNAYWYSIGWCLFFYIPTIAVMLVLAGFYKKTDKYLVMEEEDVSRQGERSHVATSSADTAPGFYDPAPPGNRGRPNDDPYHRERGGDQYHRGRSDPYTDRMYDGAEYRTGRGYDRGRDHYDERHAYANGQYPQRY